MPEASVILPVYNRPKLVCESIDSVLAQTFEDFELIVVDDGSTDGTADAVLSYNDPRITLVRHENNKGLPAARNTGVAQSRGRYLSFLDSDDLYRPEYLERAVHAMKERHLPLACHWYSLERAPGGPLEQRRPGQCNDWFWRLLFESPVPLPMVERAWFDRIGPYDETMRCGEDTDWLLRFSRHAPVAIIEEDLQITRQWCDGGVSVLRESGDEPFINFYETWTSTDDRRPNLNSRELRRFRARMEILQAGQCRRRRDRAGAMRHVARAVWLVPVTATVYYARRLMEAVRARWRMMARAR